MRHTLRTLGFMLTTPEIIVIAILGAAILLILTTRIRADLVALMVMIALPLTGVLSPQTAFSGFSRSVIFTLIGLFVISHALVETGVVRWLAERFSRVGLGSETRLVLLFMSAGAFLSLAMNNIAAGAMLLPVAIHVARESNVRPSKLLMPLSFGTLVGGMATYFTTANIVTSGILIDQGQSPLSMLDFLPTGGLIVIATIVFMVLIGRHWLPNRESVGTFSTGGSVIRSLYETYQLKDRMWEIRVMPKSQIAGARLADSGIGEELGLSVVAIWRGSQAILAPTPEDVIHVDDYLLVLGREDRVRVLLLWGNKLAREDGDLNTPRHDYSVDLTEVVVAPRSSVTGKALFEVGFRNKYGLTAVALWRGGRSYRTDVGKFRLEEGDALLMVGSPKNVSQLQRERDFLVLQSSHVEAPREPKKGTIAVIITTLVLLLSVFEIIPTAEAMLLGAIGMILTGCIDMDDAYRAVEWRVIFLIGGMLPLSMAMIDTGLAARIGGILVAPSVGHFWGIDLGRVGYLALHAIPPGAALLSIATLFVIAMLITQLVSGQISALIMAPIAISTALQTGINPQAMGVAVAIACSTAFLTPLSHPVNILMLGPGGYIPRDFLKIGLAMTVITFIVLLIGMVVFWGVR
ncbi:MAG: SLC13 family permease [Anaerolineae bacterium]